MFLIAGVPQRLQHYDDGVSKYMTPPSLPENFKDLKAAERGHAKFLYRCRLVHYHYITSTAECNELHYLAFNDPLYALRGRLFEQASAPWEGESFDLQIVLIEAMERWEELGGGGVSCPTTFDNKALFETMMLSKELSQAERVFEGWQAMTDIGQDGWVQPGDYRYAVAFLKKRKKEALAGAESAEEREEIMNHWPWDDIDEEKYM